MDDYKLIKPMSWGKPPVWVVSGSVVVAVDPKGGSDEIPNSSGGSVPVSGSSTSSRKEGT